MNKSQIEGKWLQLKGRVKEEWNELTDDEIEAADGRADYIVGKIQERYGLAKEKVEKRLKELSEVA